MINDVLHFSEDPFTFLHSPFSLCSSDYVIFINPSSSSLVLYLKMQIYFLAPQVFLINFSFQVLYFSTPEFPFGSLHHVYLFINIFCLIWNCHHTFPYFFNNISFSSLSIFTTATLKSLLQKHLICLTIFYLQCFFACLAIFCWKLDILGNIL